MNIEIETNAKYTLSLECDEDICVISLKIANDTIAKLFYYPSGVRYSHDKANVLEAILKVKGNDYNTLDDAIALWGLEDPRKKKTVYGLKKGDNFWCINTHGNVRNLLWEDTSLCHRFRSQGNCFLTEEDSKKEVAKRIAVEYIKKAISDYNNGWTPKCWEDGIQLKNYIYLDMEYSTLNFDETYCYKILDNNFYLKDKNFNLTKEFIKNYKIMLGIYE